MTVPEEEVIDHMNDARADCNKGVRKPLARDRMPAKSHRLDTGVQNNTGRSQNIVDNNLARGNKGA